MATDRPPPEAAVNMNLGSLQNALRNIATLIPYDVQQGVANLRMLADRAEEMYREQQERTTDERTPADGNTLWAWQSQQADGSWSIIAMFAATEQQARESSPEELRASNPELQVLVHRDQDAAAEMAPFAAMHRRRFGQPIRFARFKLAGASDGR